MESITHSFEKRSCFLSLTDAANGAHDTEALSSAAAGAVSGLYFHCDNEFVGKAAKLCVSM